MNTTNLISNKNSLRLLVVFASCLLTAGFVYSNRTDRSNNGVDPTFSDRIRAAPDDPAKARAAFKEASRVFFSARCANCHAAGGFPTQGDEMTQHVLDVVRGVNGRGTEDMSCTMCHQDSNAEGEGMPPGVPNWHMPPADQKMPFQGLTAGDLCRQLKDPAQNGGRNTLEESIEHMKRDALVLWAWSPGNKRTTPPMSHSDFMKKMTEWAENGGDCPL